MARYNSVSTTGSIAQGGTISTPYSGLLTTITTGSGTTNLPNPVLYAGSTQTFYNATVAAITLSTPSGVFNGPATGGTNTISLPVGAVITVVSDGTNYIAQDWLGGPASHTTITASGTITAQSTVTFNPSNANVSIQPSGTGTVTINPAVAGTIDNMAIGATTATTGRFSTVTTSGNVAIGQASTTSYALSVFGTSGRFFDALGNTTQIRLAASEGGWAGGYNWASNSGTVLGGFQGNGSGQTMSSLGMYVGAMTTPTMTLTSTQVGIGTASINAPLHVAASTNATAGIIGGTIHVRDTTANSAPATAGMAGIAFSSGPGMDWAIGKLWSGTTTQFVIKDGAAALGTQFVTINSSGYVGIKTSTPQAEIDLKGNLLVRNGIFMSESASSTIAGDNVNWHHFGYAGGANYHITGSTTGDLTISAIPGSNIVFGTVATGQPVPLQRLTIQPGGTVSATGIIYAASEIQSGSALRAYGNQARLHFYSYSEGTMGGGYVHMKTNVYQTNTQMYSVHFSGHDYSGAKSISATLGWYNYQPSNGPISIGGNAGTHSVTAYKSADGYTVMVIGPTGGYYTAFTLSQYLTTQGLADLTITAAKSTGSASGAY